MENVGRFFWNDALIREAAKCVLECFPLAKIEGMTGGDCLGQKYSELAKFEDRGAWIVAEIPLRAPSCTSWGSCPPKNPKLLVASTAPHQLSQYFLRAAVKA
jgi:hypothetical protein